ncbi:precorrin-2 C(20)-methyltransferase [Hyphomicrobium sulfonivorans]|uniref:precorrin-2 C(20)-methyltransferase n=1 Tax=Hyphomicrobium sulfonivorans TaxID=121290 RepID=UPI00156D8A1C|nr:precorrin-2 C(20)-methyltransferase [Hyphomicrobium sulfonivorans]MBI1650912.1 precorrin-2 C(20)-methyltransferase [Hyphomicrobium sulfonivorans]NSL72705.1 precorrin-2 C(20)-methyltransferase [Hyphomicrobium sulfonivorans]
MTTLESIAGGATAGTLYGVGVGPGDVRYMTLRAAGLVSTVDTVAFFAKRGQEGNARRIVAPLMADGRNELRLEYPVTDEIPASDPAYRSAIAGFYATSADALAAELQAGRSVGLLAEGDPFFYGSFMHMWRRLSERFPVEVVPGVTGMSGCWTRANTPITWGDDVLTVMPGTLTEDALIERLSRSDASVIMKIGRNFAKVKRAVEAAGLTGRAVYVERGTMQAERVMPLAEQNGEIGPYFAMVLIPGEGRRL